MTIDFGFELRRGRNTRAFVRGRCSAVISFVDSSQVAHVALYENLRSRLCTRDMIGAESRSEGLVSIVWRCIDGIVFMY